MKQNLLKRLSRQVGLGMMIAGVSFASFAEVNVGQMAPAVTEAAEELVLENDEVVYQDWAPEALTGKVRVVYHLNAEVGVDAINKPFIDAIESLNFDASAFSMLTVLNVSDSSYFVKNIAQSDFEAKREEYAEPEFVWDEEASVRTAWGLAEEGSSVTILDTEGRVVAHKDGKLEAQEVTEFVALVQKSLTK